MPEALEDSSRIPKMFGGLTVRSVFLGVLLTLIFSWVVPYNKLYIKDPGLEAGFLPAVAIFVVGLLALIVNPLLRKLSPGAAFSGAELTLIWVMTAFGSAAATLSIGTIVPAVAGGMFNFATESNQWADKFLHYVPARLTPSVDPDSRVIKALFEGLNPDETIPWGLWVRPLFYWGLLVVLMYVFFFTLGVILRRQWVERERLPFPLVRLPIEMAQEPAPGRLVNDFFSNRLMWVGFGLSAFVAAAYQIGATFPTLPQSIKLEFPLWAQLQNPPWSLLHISTMSLSLAGLGIVFILPIQISFSIWFFYFFTRMELLAKGIAGYPRSSPREPFMIYQEAGVIVCFLVFTLWLARPHLREVVKKAFTGEGVDDSQEAFSYRTAFFGFLISLIGLALWCQLVAEISLIITIAFLFLFATIVIVLTKIVAQGGMMGLEKGPQPDMLMTSVAKPSVIGMQNLSSLLLLEWTLMGGLQHSVFPQTMNTFKLGDAMRVHKRAVFVAILIVLLLGGCVSFYFSTKIMYAHGAAYLAGLARPSKRCAQEILRYKDTITNVYEPTMEDEVSNLRKLILSTPTLMHNSSEELAVKLLQGDAEARGLVERAAEQSRAILSEVDKHAATIGDVTDDEVDKLRKLISEIPAFESYPAKELAADLLEGDAEARERVEQSAQQATAVLTQADESIALLMKEHGEIPEVVVEAEPTKYARTHALFFVVGVALMFTVYFFQSRLYWWPFHPVGLLLGDMNTVLAGGWLTILVGWFIKRAVLTFGGGRAYKKLVPAFLGLIMGDAFVRIVAAVLRIATNTPSAISR